MIKTSEIASIIIAAIVFTFVVVFGKIFRGGLTLNYFLIAFVIALVILLINVFAKKLAARYYDASTEEKLLTLQRYGFYERSYFPTPIPVGVILPFILSILSAGYFMVFTLLQFDVAPQLSRVKKSVGLYRFSELSDTDIHWIAACGIIATLFFAVIAYLIGGSYMLLFAQLSIYYAFWNILPLGKLDGGKIFFGGLITWIVIAIITLIALGYAVLLI